MDPLWHSPLKANIKSLANTRDNPVLSQFFSRARFINCLRNRTSLCKELEAPPLFSETRPALFGQGRRVPLRVPWNKSIRPVRIPACAYAPVFGLCTHSVADDELAVSCVGYPHSEFWNELNEVAGIMGIRISLHAKPAYVPADALRYAKIYIRDDVKEIVIDLHDPLITPKLAGIAIAVHRMGREDVVEKVRVVPEGVTLRDAHRNRVKTFIDTACSEGDEVACYASDAIHAHMFAKFKGVKVQSSLQRSDD
jgi:hypothetical protein